MPEARGVPYGVEGGVVGGCLHEMASQHENDGEHKGHKRPRLQCIDEVGQVIGIADEEAGGHDAQYEQQGFLQGRTSSGGAVAVRFRASKPPRRQTCSLYNGAP